MDKQQFLRNLKKSKVSLHPIQIDGWDGTLYMRQPTLGEIRDTLLQGGGDDEGEKKDPMRTDPLFIARSIAKIIRDEKGVLLFDEHDDVEMKTLMDALAETAPAVSKSINEAYNRLNEPTSGQVDSSGN